MYQYDEIDRRLVRDRADEFRAQVIRFEAGALDEEQFKQLRLRNGLYQELHAPMLRVAIPYGLLSSAQLRRLAHVARRFDRGYGHFTTRQNIQFNWLTMTEVPDLLDSLAEVDMHAIQTSGNVVRNISTDHLAGVAADEEVDPRPWCEFLRQWSTLHPEFHWLPRKFKIAVNGAVSDRAAIRFHDIGLQASRDEHGAVRFEVLAGGGQGRTPRIAATLRRDLPARDLLAYVTAILRVYNLHGRRDNKHKARIKILLGAMGEDAFRAAVDAEFERIREDERLALTPEAIDTMTAMFASPDYAPIVGSDARLALAAERNPDFARWLATDTEAHRVEGYRAVTVTLKARGAAPGDATAEQMDLVADLADRFSLGEIRVSHQQNLVLADVAEDDLFDLWQALGDASLASPVRGTLADMIACPGLDYCSLANARSIPVAKAIRERFADLDRLHDLGPLELKISGCMNACGHHHVGHIGILGVEKGGEEWYQLTVGGALGVDAAIGTRIGPAVPADGIVDAIEHIVDAYVSHRHDGETFLDTVRRIGAHPFKEAVHGPDSRATTDSRRSVDRRAA